MQVQTSLTDHDGVERPHHGSSGITATSIKRGEDTQVWFEYDFDTRDEAIFLLGGLLIRILEESKDHLLINEAIALYVTKTGDTLPEHLLKRENEHRDLLREASLLLDDAYQFCMYGGDAASSLDLDKVQQWQERYQAFLKRGSTGMDEQMKATLTYQYSNERVEGDYIVADSLPIVTWECQCGTQVTNANRYNGLLHTHCTCGLLYSIDWRHGLTPRVLLISMDI